MSLYDRVFLENRSPEEVQDIDIPPISGVRGKVSRERRYDPSMFNKGSKSKANRAARKAVRQALRTGGKIRPPKGLSAYDL